MCIMKKILLSFLLLFLLISPIIYSQNVEFLIIDSLKNVDIENSEVEVYKIYCDTIDSPRIEEVEEANPLFIQKTNLINSLKNEVDNFEKGKKLYIDNSQFLENAVSSLQLYLDSWQELSIFRWPYLKKAQNEIDKSCYKMEIFRDTKSLYTACGGKSEDKISQFIRITISNINKIITQGQQYDANINFTLDKVNKANSDLLYINKNQKVNKVTGTIKRTILKIDSKNLGKDINGWFIKVEVPREMFEHAPFVGGFDNYIIKNVKTGDQYYTNGNILEKWGMDRAQITLYSNMDKFKIQRKIIDDKTILFWNGFQCVLTSDIIPSILNDDATCIRSMGQSVSNYLKLLKEAEVLALKIGNNIKLYKSRLLKESDLDQWKIDTKKCNAVLLKMQDLPFAKSENYNQQLNIEDVQLHTAILDIVSYSKETLGI